MFLVGIFLPFVGQRAVIGGVLCGLFVSITLGYFEQIGAILVELGMLADGLPALSFTWVMPSALLTTLVASTLLSLVDRSKVDSLVGLTWKTRGENADAPRPG